MDPGQLKVLLIVISLLFSCFSSLLEAALFSLNESLLHRNNLKDSREQIRISRFTSLIKHKDEIINMLLLYNNLFNILASSVITVFLVDVLSVFGISTSSVVAISTFSVTSFIYIFCESLPKMIGHSKPYEICMHFSGILRLTWSISRPILMLVTYTNNALIRLLRIDRDASQFSFKDEIIGTTEMYHKQGKFTRTDKKMLQGLLNMENVEISEIMTHRNDMYAIDMDSSNDVIKSAILNTTFSRIPVYQDKPDNILGVIKVKDVLNKVIQNPEDMNDLKKVINEVMKKPVCVPDTVDISKQFKIFQKNRQHFAFVIDEYGGLMGVVTIEDILEEIFGEIEDESDVEKKQIEKVNKNEYLVSGDFTLRDLSDAIDMKIEIDDVDTVAGLIIEKLERIPKKGDVITFDNLEFKVLNVVKNKLVSASLKINEEVV